MLVCRHLPIFIFTFFALSTITNNSAKNYEELTVNTPHARVEARMNAAQHDTRQYQKKTRMLFIQV